MIASLILSLTNYSALLPTEVRGLYNFEQMIKDQLLTISIWNTVYYAGLSVPLGT